MTVRGLVIPNGYTWRVLCLTACCSVCLSASAAPQATAPVPPRLFPVSLHGYYGYIDTTGSVVIAPRFESADVFSEGLARVCLDYRCGFIDTTGTMVIEPRFGQFGASSFSEGLANVEV